MLLIGSIDNFFYLSANIYELYTCNISFSYREPIQGRLFFCVFFLLTTRAMGAQWLGGRVLDSRPRGRGFEPHRCHFVVVLEQDTFILA